MDEKWNQTLLLDPTLKSGRVSWPLDLVLLPSTHIVSNASQVHNKMLRCCAVINNRFFRIVSECKFRSMTHLLSRNCSTISAYVLLKLIAVSINMSNNMRDCESFTEYIPASYQERTQGFRFENQSHQTIFTTQLKRVSYNGGLIPGPKIQKKILHSKWQVCGEISYTLLLYRLSPLGLLYFTSVLVDRCNATLGFCHNEL